MEAWLAALCDELGVPLDDVDVEAITDVAADVTHQVEPAAAPVTLFVAGYAAALRGGGLAAVETSLQGASELAADWTDGSDDSDLTLR